MTVLPELFSVYAIAIQVTAAAVTAYDKSAARARRPRIPEKNLWLLALLGGSAAMYITMRVTHHKTRRLAFMAGLPALFAAQLLGVVFLCLQ